MEETAARGANLFCVTNDATIDVPNRLLLPPCHPLLGVSLAVPALQLIAYHTAALRGCDIDKPRSLAKSVTVE
jgi:glucosamine--fructose-6-phosphate aminotransferase (isomerizing)